MTGAGVGMMALPVLTQSTLFIYGWRGAILLLGAFNLHSVVAAATLSPKVLSSHSTTNEASRETAMVPVRDERQANEGDQRNAIGISSWVQETRRAACEYIRGFFVFARREIHTYRIRVTPQISYIILAVILFGMTYSGWTIFVIPNAELKGYQNGDAVVVAVTGGVGNIIGRIMSGLLLKMNQSIFKASSQFTIIAAVNGVALIASSAITNFALIISLAGISGLAVGAGTVLKSLLIMATFPTERHDLSITCAMLVQGLGEACGGTLSGYIFTITTSTDLVFVMLGCCAFASSALVVLSLLHTAITQLSSEISSSP